MELLVQKSNLLMHLYRCSQYKLVDKGNLLLLRSALPIEWNLDQAESPPAKTPKAAL